MIKKILALCSLIALSLSLNANSFEDDFNNGFNLSAINTNIDFLEPSLSGPFGPIWGSMYHRDAHDSQGGLYGPGGQLEQEWLFFESLCMCDGMAYLAVENQGYRDYVNLAIALSQTTEALGHFFTCMENPPRNASTHIEAVNRMIFEDSGDGIEQLSIEDYNIYGRAIDWSVAWDERNANNNCTYDSNGNLTNP